MSDVTRQAIVVYRGTSAFLQFTMEQKGSIAGQTHVFTARSTPQSPDPPALSIPAQHLDEGSDSTPGVITVTITKFQTLTLAPGHYVFSLERTDGDLEDLLALGTMTVQADVLHAL